MDFQEFFLPGFFMELIKDYDGPEFFKELSKDFKRPILVDFSKNIRSQ